VEEVVRWLITLNRREPLSLFFNRPAPQGRALKMVRELSRFVPRCSFDLLLGDIYSSLQVGPLRSALFRSVLFRSAILRSASLRSESCRSEEGRSAQQNLAFCR
jgi:hypothetical protein